MQLSCEFRKFCLLLSEIVQKCEIILIGILLADTVEKKRLDRCINQGGRSEAKGSLCSPSSMFVCSKVTRFRGLTNSSVVSALVAEQWTSSLPSRACWEQPGNLDLEKASDRVT